jgi:alkylation response protein AidB-like acyl-CoA dehydrogenase
MSDTDPVTIARGLAGKFAATARDRDRLAGTPRVERALIRDSGLLKLVVPRELGGLGGTWPTAMQITQIFEVTGASGTGGAWGFDRFWRNARTLTLHDRVDYKVHDIGQSFLNDQWPTPSFYS